jgi:16S rRNA (cytidine1402-2'-O)-methyltransferase
MTAPGLFVVGTPIGNLSDLTERAREALQAADLVVAEDTRRSRQLLSHLGITKKNLRCIDAHATHKQVDQVLDEVESGARVALVTDAGMPSVSDPGAKLVSRCRERGLSLTVVPGPSAVTAAVALSGFADDGFWFCGFLPRKGDKRHARLALIAEFEQPVVFFESAKRIAQTLTDIADVMPARRVCVARELTKRFEEVEIKTARAWTEDDRDWLGEITVVVEAAEVGDAPSVHPDVDAMIRRRIVEGESARAIADALAPLLRISRRDVYQRALQLTNEEDS